MRSLFFPVGRRAATAARPRQILRALLGLALIGLLAGCTSKEPWHSTDITGAMPNLNFSMTRARDGKEVTAADYKGKVALLYFGYTYCPDVCPTALANVAAILKGLGAEADDVRVLFVTVDPNRDKLDVLNDYTTAFAPQVDGLRGTPDQLAALARRYRVAYSVTPSKDPAKYEVSHSDAVYVFDRKGKVRLLISSLGTNHPDVKGAESDIRRLVEGGENTGFMGWLRGIV